jgi:PHD/YefM family antitoxin component YafN of YafNO toxin-antitoxin module
MEERDWPLPVRVVCDTPEAVMEAIASLPEYGEAVIIERDGKRVAAIIPMGDLELYQRLLADEEDRLDHEAAEAARAEGGKTIPIETLMTEFGIRLEA